MFDNDMSNLTQTNRDLLHIPISGNVIVPEWLNHLRFDGGKVCLNAAAILGDVVYWYRPREVRDEMSGTTLGYERRTNDELLQRNYSQYEELYGLTNKQVRTAVKVLKSAQVIWTETHNIRTRSGAILNNVMYIGLYTGRLYEITVPNELHDPDILAGLSHPKPPDLPDRPPGLSVTGPPSRARQTALQGAADRPPGQTYTETTYSTTYKSTAFGSDNAREDTSVEVKPTNQPSSDARGDPPDAETNNGWLVGSSSSEEISLNDSETNHNQNQPAKERATEPDPPRANEEYPRAAGGAREPEADPAMLALLDDEQVRIGNPDARADLLRAAGNLDGLLHLVGYTFDQTLLGKVGDFGSFLVGLARNAYEPPRELSPAFVKSDIFARHAPEDIRAAASAQQGDGYRVPEEFADVIIG